MPIITRRHVHEVSKDGSLFFLLNAFIGAYNRRTDILAKGAGGDNSAVLTAINNLDRKVENFMATQEERLREVKVKLDAIQSGVDQIQQQLAELKANNPALEDEIAAIEATAAAIDTDVNPVVAPPAEPPV